MTIKILKVGVDLGGTKITASILDEKNKVLATVKAQTLPEEGRRYLLETIAGVLERALESINLPRKKLAVAGIACPGIVDEKLNTVSASPNLPFLTGYPLAREFTKMTGIPALIENDVNMGLYGEHQFGAAKGYTHAVGIFLETGIGGALILNGQLYRGAFGAAGELGHIHMGEMTPECGCGSLGCLEAVAGRLAISAEAALYAARGNAPALLEIAGTDLRKITSATLREAAESGDKKITELIARKAGLVGVALASVVNILDPEIIVVGGRLADAFPEIIFDGIKGSIAKYTYAALPKRKVKIVRASLGAMAPIMGVAKLAEDRLL
ncbi:MAG: ROK family protein [Elusimicrobiaceae bacterium]